MDYKRLGVVVGFTLSYLIFTTILFFALKFFGKIGNWTYYHIMILTAVVVMLGQALNKILAK